MNLCSVDHNPSLNGLLVGVMEQQIDGPYLRRKNWSRVGLCGHHFQQTGHQPGMVANPARGQLNRENGIFPVPVRAWEFGLAI